MSMSIFAWILSGRRAGVIDRNIVAGRIDRAKGSALAIKPAGVIAAAGTMIPTGITTIAHRAGTSPTPGASYEYCDRIMPAD
jgi:hypothetical protein